MSTSVQPLPDDQSLRLQSAYADAVAQKRRQLYLGVVIFGLLFYLAALGAEVDPIKFAKNFWKFPRYFFDMTPHIGWSSFFDDIAEWYWGLGKWLRLMAETLLIAYVGTVTGAIVAFFLSFFASNSMALNGWSKSLTRRLLEFFRTVPDIVFALIFVVSFGLGPFPGVLALAVHTAGALGKLFSEIIDNIDMKPVEGIRAGGGTWSHQVRFGAVPQILSNFTSYALLRFEINVRGAAVMGFVGAGGIGQLLIEYVRKFYYVDVGALLIIIIITVMIIDYGTEKIRTRLMSMEHVK
jgi:phosphonate transport system permease protein